MDGNYNWLAATVGMVLALGMTRLLASGIAVFRSRKKATLDWLPMVWAGCILFSMLEFSWTLRDLTRTVSGWTFGSCLLMFSFAVLLFLAGALILPHQELPEGGSLRAEFIEEGRWALTFLALYDFLCEFMNWAYWKHSPFSLSGAVNLALGTLALVTLRAASRRWEVWATVLYAATIIGVAFTIR